MPSVLVTGASRGIGKSIVQHLAERGWDVIAGVRAEADGAAITELNPQRISSVIAAPSASARTPAITSQPRSARCWTIDLPIPRLAPVTRAQGITRD